MMSKECNAGDPLETPGGLYRGPPSNENTVFKKMCMPNIKFKSVQYSFTMNVNFFNYMAANRHSPLTIDGHTSNFWSATQSSLTRRRAIRVLSMKHEESCSARRTKRWYTSNQLKIPSCSSENELPTSLEYGRHVNWPISRHPVQKDVDGHWMETAT